MDRTLVVEFPTFSIVTDGTNWESNANTDTREIQSQLYVQEHKLDLSGYTQNDLTVGFRRSFEQDGSANSIFWQTYDPNSDVVVESTIISSVPMTDTQVGLATALSPGFIPYFVSGVDWGNFNREHIIHGRLQYFYANSIVGAGAFNAVGNAIMQPMSDTYFSSLEPTAADCLYCYRVFAVPRPGDRTSSGIDQVTLPPKRIILDAFTVEEPHLEYMMRLKRSYELANQV